MIYDLDWAESIAQDMADLKASDVEQWAMVEALFQQLDDDDELLCFLGQSYKARDSPRLDIKPVLEARDNGNRRIHRVKLYRSDGTPLGFRVLYGVSRSYPRGRIVILGVAARNTSYKPESAFWERICRDYDAVGLPPHTQ
jgi:hypothetical protein